MEKGELIDLIAECAKTVRKHFAAGFEEKIYKNAMFIELQEAGLKVETEVPFSVTYKRHVLGCYRADIIVEDRVIVELKAVAELIPIHEVQLVNYLSATGIEDGMLINFGADRLQMRHRTRFYTKKSGTTSTV